MSQELSFAETTVVATYSNRHDAEVARSILNDRGIASFVVADDVHPPLQLTEGVKLRVMKSEARNALETLGDSTGLSSRTPAESDRDARFPRDEHIGDFKASIASPARATAWVYLWVFALVAVAIVVGLLVSVIS